MKILHVMGARPNFMKVAPVLKAFDKKDNVEQLAIHAGQHYDINMSDIFFEQLGIPAPGCQSRGRIGERIADILMNRPRC